jgi:hypothetical protein
VGALPDLAACRAMSAPAARLLPRMDDAERAAARERWLEHVAKARGEGG